MASINNILGNEANQLSSNAPEAGKQRGKDPEEAASHVDHHKPSAKEKIVGTVRAWFGKTVGDQDLISEGKALRKGNVERGSE